MVEIICECVVKKEARGQFQLAFGPGGAWSRVFAEHPGFRGTTVLRDTANPERVLIVDLWDTAAQREQALAESAAEVADLQAAFDDWTESRNELGVFQVLGEATVRPRRRAGRGRRMP